MKYLGVDFGLKRVGLAISEGEIAAPFKVLNVSSFKDAVEKVSKEAKDQEVDKIIVGKPEGKMGSTVSGFINALKKEKLTVEEADETLSSKQAIAQMVKLNVSKTKRKVNDAYSAAIILQNYLDKILV